MLEIVCFWSMAGPILPQNTVKEEGGEPAPHLVQSVLLEKEAALYFQNLRFPVRMLYCIT